MLGGAGFQPSTVASFVLTWVSAWPVKKKEGSCLVARGF